MLPPLRGESFYRREVPEVDDRCKFDFYVTATLVRRGEGALVGDAVHHPFGCTCSEIVT